MSPVQAERGGWFRQHYEKIVLIVVLIILLGSALWLVVAIGLGQKAIADAQWAKPPAAPNEAERTDLREFESALKVLNAPFQSQSYTNDLLVSELRVWSINPEDVFAPIPYYAKVCPFTGHPQPPVVPEEERDSDADGMKNIFERQHGFDPLDPMDANLDKDGDGFTNVEEFQFGTNPSDSADFPELPAKLRVARIRRTPFLLRFQGVQELPDGAQRFLLNLRTLERSYFVKVGDDVAGYTVKGYQPDAEAGPTLSLEKEGERIDLVKGRRVDKHEVVAYMVFLLDKSRFIKRVDEELQLKDRRYKVIDIKANTVSIRDVETGKLYRVGRLTESEKEQLLGAPRDQSGTGSTIPASSTRPADADG